MAALHLLIDLADDARGEETRCWRAATDDLLFLYWMGLETGESLLREDEQQEVENHIATCRRCREAHDQELIQLQHPHDSEHGTAAFEAPGMPIGHFQDDGFPGHKKTEAAPTTMPPYAFANAIPDHYDTGEVENVDAHSPQHGTAPAPASVLDEDRHFIILQRAHEYGLAQECVTRWEMDAGNEDGIITLDMQPGSADGKPFVPVVSVLYCGNVLDQQVARPMGRTYRAMLHIKGLNIAYWSELSFELTTPEGSSQERPYRLDPADVVLSPYTRG